MNITAFIMGICPPQRLDWLKLTIDDIDSQNFPFVKKIIAIDEFDGYKFSENLIEYYNRKGWDVLIDSHRSRKLTMDRAFAMIDSEWIFYHEDDVMVKLPEYSIINKIVSMKDENNRDCGMISMNIGGSVYDAPTNNYGDIIHMNENTLYEKEGEMIIFKRLEKYMNYWFFCFPALFIRKDIFLKCHNDANKSMEQIEMGLTTAYLRNKFHRKFFKCTVAKHNTLELVLSDPYNIQKCDFLTILDPNQGVNPHGGGHHYI